MLASHFIVRCRCRREKARLLPENRESGKADFDGKPLESDYLIVINQ